MKPGHLDEKEIDYRFERPYFLAPADDMAGEGFAVIRDAPRETGKVGLGQVTVSGREWLVAVAPLCQYSRFRAAHSVLWWNAGGGHKTSLH